MNKINCIVVGAGYMTDEYLKVLKFKNIHTCVVGRSKENASKIQKKYNIETYYGGIEAFQFKIEYSHAIVAASIQNLFLVTCILIKSGVKNILVEKPACLTKNELKTMHDLSVTYNTNVFIAYNRRFYSSIDTLKKYIIEEGGIENINFEFTEWVNTIDQNKFTPEVLRNFFLANSTHVVDTVFHLAGHPSSITSIVSGNSVSWHPTGSIFNGCGISVNNIPFTYSSNWGSAGRWSIEVLTKENRYYLKPMEKLYRQSKGSIELCQVQFEDQLDQEFKPGIFKMVEQFLNDSKQNLCTLNEHFVNFAYYEKIAGYSN